MKNCYKAALIILAALANAAHAQSTTKPGLWEVQLVKQVIDGKDITAQMAAMQKQMQTAMANMPPAQRKQFESMMGKKMQGNGMMNICISPEMAKQDQPVLPKEVNCKPSTISKSGATTNFAINCNNKGVQMTGQGSSTRAGDSVTNTMDMVVVDKRGKHSMHSQTVMKYLGSQCGDVLPADKLAAQMQGKGQ